ncbi:hypothetical protein [Paenibacillus sp. FSL K6-1318]|uniref:hypothetical protein n=1 Tax=Paenibacillus sp. FSL K6-1318 TaxID=2975291 RepID=UPI0030EF03D2
MWCSFHRAPGVAFRGIEWRHIGVRISFYLPNQRNSPFRFLLKAGDTEVAKYYLQELHAEYGAEKRWAILEEKYSAVFAEYGL